MTGDCNWATNLEVGEPGGYPSAQPSGKEDLCAGNVALVLTWPCLGLATVLDAKLHAWGDYKSACCDFDGSWREDCTVDREWG